jgi:hypothetical protein
MSVFKDDLEEAAFVSSLKNMGITELVAEYEGSGDSGSIETVYGKDKEGEIIHLDISVDSKAEEMLYEVLSDNYMYDWYNNDGGYGSVTIDLEDKAWRVDGYVRTTEEANASGKYGTSK